MRISSHNYGYATYFTFALFLQKQQHISAISGKMINFFNDIDRTISLVSGCPCPKSLPILKILKSIGQMAHLGTRSQHERNNFQK